jgi:hypothetical protein
VSNDRLGKIRPVPSGCARKNVDAALGSFTMQSFATVHYVLPFALCPTLFYAATGVAK